MPAHPKNILIAFCLIFWPWVSFCQTTQLPPEWVSSIGGPGSSANATGVKVDDAENVYVTGYFKGTVDFDPSTATRNLSSAAGNTSGFIAKYKDDGTLLWAYQLPGANVSPSGLSVGNGAISIIGKFNGSFDANPGAATNTLTGSNDAFVIHLKDDGSFLWAKSIGGTGADAGNEIATDQSGNTYAALQFQSTVTVDGTNYTAKGTTDGMLVKYDQAGNVAFVIDLGYAASENTVSGVAVDKAGNIDIIGYLNGPVNFNPLGVANASSAQQAMYLAQYLPNGTLKWVTNIKQGFSNNNNINIALSSSDEIYLTGNFTNKIEFTTTNTFNVKGARDLFVARYTSQGDFTKAEDIGRAGAAVMPTDISITNDGKFYYISGYFSGAPNFSNNAVAYQLTAHGPQDLFLARYKIANDELDVAINTGNGGCANTAANGLAVINDDKVIVAGTFCSAVSFGAPTCNVYDASAKGSQDMFLAKYSVPLPIINNIISNAANCNGGPNVLVGSVPEGGIGTFRYEWQSSTDGHIFTEMDPAQTGQSLTPPVTNSDIYYLRKVFSSECKEGVLSNPIAVGPSSGKLEDNIIDQPTISEFCEFLGTGVTGHEPKRGGGFYTYQWQTATSELGPWKDLVNLGSGDKDIYKQKDVGNIDGRATTYVRRLVMIPGCDPDPSNVIKLTVYPPIEKYTYHATGGTEFCDSGDPGTITPDSPLPTGGNGVYTYKWLRILENPYSVETIAGEVGPELRPGILYETTTFKREVTSGPCYTGDIGRNGNPVRIHIKKKITIANTINQPNDGVLCRTNADPSNIVGDSPSGGTGTYTYQWQQSTDGFKNNIDNISGATEKDYNPNVITQTTYYRRAVTFTGAEECADISFSASVVAQVATANITQNEIQKSAQDPDIICALPAKPHTITGSPAVGNGVIKYQWQKSVDGGAHFNDIDQATDANYDPPEISSTTIYHRLAIVDDKCVAPLPSNDVTIAVSPTASLNSIQAPADSVFCDAGNASVIYGLDVTGNGVHYQWQSSPDGKPETYTDITTGDYNQQNFDPLANNVTMYYRRAVTTAVCNVPSVSNAVAIKVFPTPVVSMSADSVYICEGDNLAITASGGSQYKWTPAEGLSATDIASPKASPKATTIYSVEVSNEGYCSENGLIKVIVVPRPTANAGADKRMFRGESIKLDGKVTGENLHYSWSPTTYLDDPNSLNPVVTAPQTTTYTLTVTSDHGCNIVSDDVKISVYERVVIPTGFTPNGDGINDLWEIPALSTYPGNTLTVFNRNGTEVFRTINYAKPWDGAYGGHTLPFGTYYYVIDLKDGTKPLSGWVSLIK